MGTGCSICRSGGDARLYLNTVGRPTIMNSVAAK